MGRVGVIVGVQVLLSNKGSARAVYGRKVKAVIARPESS
jgi:hypothetical protein